MSQNYYEILLKDGETILVKPEHVAVIQSDLDSGKDFIGGDRKISRYRIVDFRPTDKRYIEESTLIESGEPVENTGVFGPVITDRGVKSVAVKKPIPARKVEEYVKRGYKTLETREGYNMMGFWLPLHLVTENVTRCTPAETKKLK